MAKNIFDMEPEMEGDEPAYELNVPNSYAEAEDEDALPFIHTLKDNKPKVLTEAPVGTPPAKKDPQAPPDLDTVRSLMGTINKISGQPVIQPKAFRNIAQVKDCLTHAGEILRNSEVWLPKGKTQMAPQLDKVGGAIAKAIQSYIAHIEKME